MLHENGRTNYRTQVELSMLLAIAGYSVHPFWHTQNGNSGPRWRIEYEGKFVDCVISTYAGCTDFDGNLLYASPQFSVEEIIEKHLERISNERL